MYDLIIFVSGPAGSGKTTAAEYLQKLLGDEAYTITLADPLKELIYNLCKEFDFPIGSLQDLYTPGVKENYRSIMQHVGTEICQSTFGQDCWCRAATEKLSSIYRNKHKYPSVLIVSDFRFKHEFEYFNLRAKRTLILNIERKSCKTIQHSNHISEQLNLNEFYMYKNCCLITVQNDESKESLYEILETVVDTVL
jgi:phosphomevalonate kinase